MRSRWPGYVSCGAHGGNGHGADLVDVNCGDCIRLPNLKAPGEFVGDLRAAFGLERDVMHVAYGEQLALELAS